MITKGYYYETPSGRVMVREALPVVKFITKQEFDKHVNTMESRSYVCHCVENLITNQKVVLYYIKKAR